MKAVMKWWLSHTLSYCSPAHRALQWIHLRPKAMGQDQVLLLRCQESCWVATLRRCRPWPLIAFALSLWFGTVSFHNITSVQYGSVIRHLNLQNTIQIVDKNIKNEQQASASWPKTCDQGVIQKITTMHLGFDEWQIACLEDGGSKSLRRQQVSYCWMAEGIVFDESRLREHHQLTVGNFQNKSWRAHHEESPIRDLITLIS